MGERGAKMKNNIFSLLFLLSIIFVFVVFYPFKSFLVIEPREDSGKSPVYFALDEKDRFSIRYTHSIHLSEVEEFYRQTDGMDIQQTKLIYEDTAIGMPSDAAGQEEFSRTEDGRYVITNMDRRFPYIDLQIGRVAANHRLIYHDQVFPLKEYFKEGSFVRLQIKNVSLFKQWKGVIVVGKR
jgi:hypothetical protein